MVKEGEERAILSFSYLHKQFSAECEQGLVGSVLGMHHYKLPRYWGSNPGGHRHTSKPQCGMISVCALPSCVFLFSFSSLH